MTGISDAIAAIYAQVAAPEWAARNLDALADVLRDLSWLPEGPVPIELPADAPAQVAAVVRHVAAERANAARPVFLIGA